MPLRTPQTVGRPIAHTFDERGQQAFQVQPGSETEQIQGYWRAFSRRLYKESNSDQLVSGSSRVIGFDHSSHENGRFRAGFNLIGPLDQDGLHSGRVPILFADHLPVRPKTRRADP